MLVNQLKKTDFDAKITNIEGNCFTTADYKKFTSDMLGAKIKHKELINNCDISNLVKNSDLVPKLSTVATKQN